LVLSIQYETGFTARREEIRMGFRINRTTGWVLVIAGLLMLAAAAVKPGRSWAEYDSAYAGSAYVLPEGVTVLKKVEFGPSPDKMAELTGYSLRMDSTGTPSLSLKNAGYYRLVPDGASQVPILVRTLPPGLAWWAIAGAFLVLLGLPYIPCGLGGEKDSAGNPVSPWYELMSEYSGGYSLSRIQLLIWFVPALLIFSALSVPLHQFAPVNTSMAILLGLSGATTLLGTAANPAAAGTAVDGAGNAPGGAPPPAPAHKPPSFCDLGRGCDGHADLSRYQNLLLTLFGALMLLVKFLDGFTMPVVPDEFLALVGVSQAAYVGTKAVKTTAMNASNN
jgi:hypothetical protein